MPSVAVMVPTPLTREPAQASSEVTTVVARPWVTEGSAVARKKAVERSFTTVSEPELVLVSTSVLAAAHDERFVERWMEYRPRLALVRLNRRFAPPLVARESVAPGVSCARAKLRPASRRRVAME